MNVFGVIMAGGGGTRFWPLSRKQMPKQLLNLSGKDIMLNEAIHRVATVAPYQNIYVVTNQKQVPNVKHLLCNGVPLRNVLSEPAARNTAACVGYAAIKILKDHGDGIMVITPSDAYIRDEATFTKVLNTAIEAATQNDALVTVGITPTFAATGYGYIKCAQSDDAVKQVECFVEKPDKTTAERYLQDGNYVWNSGMFIWKASVILNQFKQYLPDVYADLKKIFEATDEEEEHVVNTVYPQMRSISIDYGIMEKAQNILVVPAEFGWSDVGSFDMLTALHSPDEQGNVALGDAVLVDSKNSIVYASGRTVTTVGVDGLIVIETPDAVMVCPKDDVQSVKKIVEELQKQGREELL